MTDENALLAARHYLSRLPDGLPCAAPALGVAETIAELQAAFDVFDNWTDRYQYIIDLGKSLPPLPAAYCTEAHRLHGCQSRVWLVMAPHAGRLHMYAASDALIVSGLIALMMRVYSGRTAGEIAGQDTGFVDALGLGGHISTGRKNGLLALAGAVQAVALRVQQLEGAVEG